MPDNGRPSLVPRAESTALDLRRRSTDVSTHVLPPVIAPPEDDEGLHFRDLWRQALAKVYPEIDKLELIDFRVRILDASHGTDAVTRVLIETSDGETSWNTLGVAANIVEASWKALVDGITFGLRRHEVPVR